MNRLLCNPHENTPSSAANNTKERHQHNDNNKSTQAFQADASRTSDSVHSTKPRAPITAYQCPNASHHTPSMESKLADLTLCSTHPSLIMSFLAWLLLSFISTHWLVPRMSRRKRPSIGERLRSALKPSILMLVLQFGFMLLRLQTPVVQSYHIIIGGQKAGNATSPLSPLWRLAAGCWFLALAVALTIGGVVGILVEAGAWKKRIGEVEGCAKVMEEPLCP